MVSTPSAIAGLKRTKARALWRYAHRRAICRGLPFTITPDDITIPDRCPVYDIPLSLTNSQLADDSPTLDRFIPEMGYVPGNVRVVSGRANRHKSDASPQELRMLLEDMERYAYEEFLK